MNASSLSRWRKRLGEKGLEKILQATLKLALTIGFAKKASFETVIADTTVMEKNITYPTDGKLYYRSLQILNREDKRHNIRLRQSYTFLAKRALRKSCQYAHARQMKRANRERKRLHTYLGRVYRDIKRALEKKPSSEAAMKNTLDIISRILHQQRTDKNKIYSVHEPNVECISKGKAHKKYEFGCKASIVVTHKEGLVLSIKSFHGNPYDGHTLKESLSSAEALTGRVIKKGFVDKGYKGHKIEDKEIYISGQKNLSYHYKKQLKRRQWIEPHIGHMKNDGKLGRNYLKGKLGDLMNAILCGIGHNLRLILYSMRSWHAA